MPAALAQAIVHGRSSGAVTSYNAVALGSNVTEGNMLVCMIAAGEATPWVPTATGYRFNRLHFEAFDTGGGDFAELDVYVARVPANAAAPTITVAGTSGFVSVITMELSGAFFGHIAWITEEGSGTTTTSPGLSAYGPGLGFGLVTHRTAVSPSITEPGGWSLQVEEENTTNGMPYSLVSRSVTEGDSFSPGWTLGATSAWCMIQFYIYDAPVAEARNVQCMSGHFVWDPAMLGGHEITLPIGFRPKVILFFTGGSPAFMSNGAARLHLKIGQGALVDGSPQQNVATASYDNTSSAIDTRDLMRDDACIIEGIDTGLTPGRISGVIGDVETVLTIDSETSDSLNVFWLAIGGSLVTAAKVVTANVPVSTGNADITGFGFNPSGSDAVLMCFGVRNANGALPFDGNNATPFFGVATALAQVVQVLGDLDGAGTVTSMQYYTTSECVGIFNAGITDIEARASWNAWITDGVQLNWAEVANQHKFFALIINGGRHTLSHFAQLTTTGLITPASNISTRAAGLLFGGVNRAADTPGTPTSDDPQYSFGVAHTTAAGTAAFRGSVNQGGFGIGSGARGRMDISYDRVFDGLDDSNTPVNELDVETVSNTGFTVRQEVANADTEPQWVWSVGEFEFITPITWITRPRPWGGRPRPFAPGRIR